MRNSHRDLLPNIDTAYFCNIGMEKPHKHWVYAGPLPKYGTVDKFVRKAVERIDCYIF